MKKILFIFSLVISFILTSCETVNVARGDYMIVRQIRCPYNDSTVEYVVNAYIKSGNYIKQLTFRDEANKYQINDTLILVKKCAY